MCVRLQAEFLNQASIRIAVIKDQTFKDKDKLMYVLQTVMTAMLMDFLPVLITLIYRSSGLPLLSTDY